MLLVSAIIFGNDYLRLNKVEMEAVVTPIEINARHNYLDTHGRDLPSGKTISRSLDIPNIWRIHCSIYRLESVTYRYGFLKISSKSRFDLGRFVWIDRIDLRYPYRTMVSFVPLSRSRWEWITTQIASDSVLKKIVSWNRRHAQSALRESPSVSDEDAVAVIESIDSMGEAIAKDLARVLEYCESSELSKEHIVVGRWIIYPKNRESVVLNKQVNAAWIIIAFVCVFLVGMLYLRIVDLATARLLSAPAIRWQE